MNYHETQKRVNGRFATDTEPAVSKLTVRVPHSLRAEVEKLANGRIAQWLREAIAEKIAREQQQAFNKLLNSLQDDTLADTVTLLVPVDNQQNLAVKATIGLEAEIEQKIRIPIGQGIAGNIAFSKKLMIVNNLSEVEVVSPILRQIGVKSLMGVPVPIKRGVFGVLHIGMFRPHQFDESDIKQLRVTAKQFGLMIAEAGQADGKLGNCELRRLSTPLLA